MLNRSRRSVPTSTVSAPAPAPAAGRDERGNLVIAMAVLLILANLSVAVLARALTSLNQVRKAQDYSAALATADGALADAVFQIDQGTPAVISGSGSLGNGTFSYVATRVDDNTYDVKAKGIIGGSAHGVRATVTRRVRFPYAIFSNQGLTFNGNSTANIYSFNADAPTVATGNARVGSNRAVVVNSGAGAGDFQDYFSPGGSCIGCPNPVLQQGPYDLSPATVPAGTTTQPCPTGGVFTGSVSGTGGTPFLCNQDVSFVGTVTITSTPVIVYITANHKLTMADAVVNKGGRGIDLQVYKDGSGALEMGSGSHGADFTGVLYAPGTDLTVNGGMAVRGALAVNSLRVNGAPNYTLAYDLGLRAVLDQNWRVGRWREVPSGSLGF